MAELQTPTEAATMSTSPMKDAQLPAKSEINGTLSEETPLFSPSLLSPQITAALPEGYSVRPLRKSDYHHGEKLLPLHIQTNTLD